MLYAGEREREVMYAGEREREGMYAVCCTQAPAATTLLCILRTAYIERENIYIYIERERERSNVSCAHIYI